MQQFSLAELDLGAQATIERIGLHEADTDHLMQLGFLPGSTVSFERAAPLGGPLVFRVEGVDVAMRRETARQVYVRPVGK